LEKENSIGTIALGEERFFGLQLNNSAAESSIRKKRCAVKLVLSAYVVQ
jgi:hypothetical protein